MKVITVVALVLILATSVYGLDKKAFQMREDFGTEPLYDCYMDYFYYIPCAGTAHTSSWFWMYTNWDANDIIGAFFTVGDQSMTLTTVDCNPAPSCDPCNMHTLEQFRILDFAGYGTVYPGLFTTEFSIYCSDDQGCPIGGPLWMSGPVEFCAAGWNYIDVNPDLCLTGCGDPCYPTFLIAAKMIGSNPIYPAWGMDNISTPIGDGCIMHDMGCCPALYPRPAISHYPVMHSGYYGTNAFTYCPPLYFVDGADTTGGTTFGCIELAWRIYLINSGQTATEPSTWGNIKTMYR